MKPFLSFLMLLLLVAASGCGGDKERGMNRPDQKRDLPRAVPRETDKGK